MAKANEKRLIDANEAYELHSNYPMFARSRADLTDLRDILDEAMTVDAVEVVRCKDCIELNWMERCDHLQSGLARFYCPYANGFVPLNHFCSYGERKDNEKVYKRHV